MKSDKTLPILGIGTDIIEIERIHEGIKSHGNHFTERLFTVAERDYCLKFQDPVPHFAGRFCAKEAIVKAFGSGFGEHASWHDIEILNDVHGKPVVTFSDKIIKKFNHPVVLLSISHCKLYVTATALWIRNEVM